MLKNGINLAKATVGVLGVTFKENCPDVRNSKVIDLIREFEDWGVQTKVMDPWADDKEVREEYGLQLQQITPTNKVDSLVVAVAHKQFAQMTSKELKALCLDYKKPVLADLKSLYDRKALEEDFNVFRL
jgi:UDP-N-acetyl-D-galactosamine dehydrogenase